MSDWPWLFYDETFAEVVNRRVALAEAAREDESDGLILRLSLDVPVPAGVREIKRWITEPYTDRFDDEVPGGSLGIEVGYIFTGDASLLTVKPDSLELTRGFMGKVVGDAVQLSHLGNGQDEATLQAAIASTEREFAHILKHLRADAAPHNAELARRIREICGG